MQYGAGSRHARRRSARRPINTAESSRHDRNDEQEEVRWSLEEDAWSEEDSKSNSDNGRYGGRSDDDGQDDEETGLTGSRGKRSRQRREGRGLDRRIVKDSEITSEEKKEADQSVIKNMLINGMFIGLWYITSLPPHPSETQLTTHQVHLLPLHLDLQQMDVLQRKPRLPLPPLHDLHAYARTILSRLPRPVALPTIPPPSRFTLSPKRDIYCRRAAQARSRRCRTQAAYDQALLLHETWSLRCCDGTGYWSWKYVVAVHHSHILQ